MRGNRELDLTVRIKGNEIIDKDLPSTTPNSGSDGLIVEINQSFKKKIVPQNSKRMKSYLVHFKRLV